MSPSLLLHLFWNKWQLQSGEWNDLNRNGRIV